MCDCGEPAILLTVRKEGLNKGNTILIYPLVFWKTLYIHVHSGNPSNPDTNGTKVSILVRFSLFPVIPGEREDVLISGVSSACTYVVTGFGAQGLPESGEWCLKLNPGISLFAIQSN